MYIIMTLKTATTGLEMVSSAIPAESSQGREGLGPQMYGIWMKRKMLVACKKPIESLRS